MKHLAKHLLLLAALFSGAVMANDNPVSYVNPNLGTSHSRWFFYTPAAVPFGMAKLAPSTDGSYGDTNGWEAVGYDDTHRSIEGFACFHEFQVGGVMLMPVVGTLKTVPGVLTNTGNGYRSDFDKKQEYATAGYYSVVLKKYGVKAELTATKRVGLQRYTFPASKQSYVVFDIGNRLGESGYVKDAAVEMVDDHTVEGYVVTEPEYVIKYQPGADVRMYFHAELNKPVQQCHVFYRGGVLSKGTKIKGVGACMALQYATTAGEQIEAKIGLSYTSVDNARKNLQAEAAAKNFDQVKNEALAQWKESLSRITVETPSKDNKIKFYTGLYHALLGRGLASDISGAYPKSDGTVGQIPLDAAGKPQYNHYNTDAVWGTFWNLNQLWAIAYPEYFSDFVKSQLLVYKDAGWLGDGIACSKYVSGVGTNFVGLAMATAYNCGIRDFNAEQAYEAARKDEVEYKNRPEGAGKTDVRAFVERGFCPYLDGPGMPTTTEGSVFGTSHTLEDAYGAYALAQFAKNLHKTADYKYFTKLAGNWKNIFDPETKCIRPRMMDGTFLKDFAPLAPWRGFQEGNALQYTFYVPQQMDQLVAMMGKDKFNKRLDSIFTTSAQTGFGGGTSFDAFSGVNAVYNQGNEPDLQMPWLFYYSERPDLSQKWVQAICNDFYGTTGVHGYGYGQDEDQGQLGAWYVMSSLGLFDVQGLTGANPSFNVGSPLFTKVEIKLNNTYYKGKTFTIVTNRATDGCEYVQSAKLNGKKMKTLSLPFQALTKGGVLTLDMGTKPCAVKK